MMNSLTGIEVRVNGLQINFGDFVALQATDLTIKKGELFTLLGPSGCGKTTLLRCLAGFLKPEVGQVLFDEQDVSRVDPWNRGIGFVFQNYALWPTKTIFKNVAYGLEMRGEDRTVIKQKVADTLEMVGLSKAAHQYPGELSGGMQQRAALARAIIIDPPLLLFDEPLSNLDAKLRVKLRRDIRALQTRLGLTAIYVTHDQEEALDISDRIAVMQQGQVCQVGTPREIYQTPRSTFVADFVGKAAFLKGHGISERRFKLLNGKEISGQFTPATKASNAVVLFARPETIRFVSVAETELVGRILEASYLGNVTRYLVEVEEQTLLVESNQEHDVNEIVGIQLPTMQMFDTLS